MTRQELARHTLGWIGAGRMGHAMVARLLNAGCKVAVYNRTSAKAESLAALGAELVYSPAELARRDVVFTMVHANHSNSIVDDGKSLYAGEPAGFIARLPGGLVVYHAGDTNLFGDMRLIGEMYRPQLALLPIGDVYTMGPREAAHSIRLLGVRHIVPMHYGTFPLLTGTPAALKAETGDVAGLEIHALEPGESLE